MIKYSAILVLLTVPSIILGQHVPVVEDTISGITVGKSTLHDVAREFGKSLIVDPKEKRHAVRWEGQCELFFDFEKGGPIEEDNHVMNIQLLNLGGGTQPGSPCSKIATGHGLRLTDSPDALQRLYGEPSSVFGRQQLTVARYENSGVCQKKALRAFQLKNMFVEWQTDSKVLQNVSVSVEKGDCNELRSPN
jgi:hypothetical protein